MCRDISVRASDNHILNHKAITHGRAEGLKDVCLSAFLRRIWIVAASLCKIYIGWNITQVIVILYKINRYLIAFFHFAIKANSFGGVICFVAE